MSGGATVPAERHDEAGDDEHSVSAPADQELTQRELSHDEYDPKGTLALILLYFVVLAFMWTFMYFVEFLGGDMLVVG
jgi:hypothetical protein